jgi:hypothetical protein
MRLCPFGKFAIKLLNPAGEHGPINVQATPGEQISDIQI